MEQKGGTERIRQVEFQAISSYYCHDYEKKKYTNEYNIIYVIQQTLSDTISEKSMKYKYQKEISYNNYDPKIPILLST